MVDTARSLAALQTLLATNGAGGIDAQDLRDFLVSVYGPFNPAFAPLSPHADDDEFDDASLGGSWTEFDPGSDVTVTEDAYGVLIVNANASLPSWGGIRRAVPAGDWSLTVKMGVNGITGQHAAGFLLADDLVTNPTTADLHGFDLNIDGDLRVATWTAYNGFGAQNALTSDWPQGGQVYCRIRRVSTTYSFDASFDGVTFRRMHEGSVAFTPAYILLGANAESAGSPAARFRFYRRSANTSLTVPILGR